MSFEAIAKISFACEAAGDQSHVLFHLRPSAWREGPSEGSGGSEDPFGDRSQEFYFRENVEEPAAVPTVDGDQLKALRPLEVARQRQPLDWLNAAGCSPLERPGLLTLQLNQLRELQLSSGADRLQLLPQSGMATLQLLPQCK